MQSAGYASGFREATDEAMLGEKNLVCDGSADHGKCCSKRPGLRSEIVSGDAMEVYRAVPWRKNSGNHGRPWAAECVLHGSSQWGSLENDGFWEHLDAHL